MPGDLKGPWVLNDLQTALNDFWITWATSYGFLETNPSPVGVASWYHADASDRGMNPNSGYYAPPGDSSDDYAAAKAAAEGAFPGTAGGYTLQRDDVTERSGGTSYMIFRPSESLDLTDPGWTAVIDVIPIKPAALGIPSFCNRTVDFYVGATTRQPGYDTFTEMYSIPGSVTVSEFDANGTGLLEDQFHKVGSVGPTNAAEVAMTATVGDPATLPTVPDLPGGGIVVDAPDHVRGYQTHAMLAIIKWKVTGGAQYVAP